MADILKNVQDDLPFSVDFDDLESTDDISSQSVEVVDQYGDIADADTIAHTVASDGQKVTFWLKDGTAGYKYDVNVKCQSTGGVKLQKTLTLKVVP